MTILFNTLLTLTIILLILKLIFSFIYFQKINSLEKSKIDESKYTIVQPILSGDPRLEDDLIANLKNTTDMMFIWLVDKSDKIAISTVKNILENKKYSNRLKVYYLDDVPQEVNPKIFKLEQVVDKIKTEYTIILDDDSVIDRKRLDELSIYEKDKTVLKNISFKAKQGTSTALVGSSGSGKTTVTNLIARFWDCQSGIISIDGTDITKIYPEELLTNISMIFQDVYLVNDTVENNIKLGKGVAINVIDSMTIMNRGLLIYIENLCRKNDIPYQLSCFTDGGTDAGNIHKSGTGIPATTLSIPMRYMHTHLGVVHKDDIIATLKLLKLIIEDLTPEKYDRILKENYNYSE